MERVCTKCGFKKPLDDFGKHKLGKFGHRPDCKACVNQSRFGKRKKIPLDKQRVYMLKSDYNLTPEDYSSMFTLQEGRCAICKKHQVDLKDSLCVDHDHTTGLVRGLLCKKCNMALGLLGDDFNSLLRAIEYLKQNRGVD